MAKVKTKNLAIDWVEETKGILTGYVSESGPGTAKLIDELLNIPVDIPDLTQKDKTTEVSIVYPNNFAEDRKQILFEEVQKMYPEWKVEISEDKKVMKLYPNFERTQL